ncbi:MAG: acyl-CoA thioesterase [Alphaproteobacteria bacterium]|nr:acyl-CoA thioesterase [Alphaproteobacteria bacterium]
MARRDYKFFHRFRIRYSEIDGQGIVFNAHYLTYFDQGITEYFRALCYDYKAETQRTGHDFHTVRTLVEYAKPIEFDEEIDVCVKAGRIGRSSIRLDFEIHGRDREDFRASGEVVWVYTNQETHKSAAVPDDLVERLVGLEGGDIRPA